MLGISYFQFKTNDKLTCYIPLQFWFNRNPGLALPLIALQHHDIVLKVQLRSLENCIWASKQIDDTSNNTSTYNNSVGQDIFTTKPADGCQLFFSFLNCIMSTII